MRFSFPALLAAGCWLLSACHSSSWRTESGIIYQVIPAEHPGDTALAGLGSIVKLHYRSYVGDSLIDNNEEQFPVYATVMPPASFGYNPLQVLGYGVREGDSIITSQIVDTMVSRHVFPALKSWMRPGAEWTTRIKILRVFRPGQDTDSLLREDKLREKRRTDSVQAILGPQRVARMLSQKHITAEPAGDGVFVERLAKGAGPVADSGMVLQLRYAILSLDGTHLDSNADTAAAQPPLFQYISGTQFMLPVVDKVIRTLRQGDHVRIYLPTMQALGDRPFGTSGRPYEDLIFDVELVRAEPGKP